MAASQATCYDRAAVYPLDRPVPQGWFQSTRKNTKAWQSGHGWSAGLCASCPGGTWPGASLRSACLCALCPRGQHLKPMELCGVMVEAGLAPCWLPLSMPPTPQNRQEQLRTLAPLLP